MTTLGEESIRREYEERARRAERDRRERGNLTVQHFVRSVARCDRCHAEWPYKPGDENKPCPKCGGGSRSWGTNAS